MDKSFDPQHQCFHISNVAWTVAAVSMLVHLVMFRIKLGELLEKLISIFLHIIGVIIFMCFGQDCFEEKHLFIGGTIIATFAVRYVLIKVEAAINFITNLADFEKIQQLEELDPISGRELNQSTEIQPVYGDNTDSIDGMEPATASPGTAMESSTT